MDISISFLKGEPGVGGGVERGLLVKARQSSEGAVSL